MSETRPSNITTAAFTPSAEAATVNIVPAAPARLNELVDMVADRYPLFDRHELATSYQMTALIPERTMFMAVAPGGTVVGFGEWFRPVYFRDGWLAIRLVVRTGWERRGIGRSLRAAVLQALPPGTDKITTVVMDDDPESLAVAYRWGFSIEGHPIRSEIPLTAAMTAPPLPEHVTEHPCSDLTFADRPAIEAMLATDSSPEAAAGMRVSLDDLAAAVGPGMTPVGVLTRLNDHPVAIAYGVLDDHTLNVTYTGVHPDHRRRGLGRLTKQALHAAAAGQGGTLSATYNDEHNTAIRALNADLGYTVTFGFYRVAQHLPPPRAGASAPD